MPHHTHNKEFLPSFSLKPLPLVYNMPVYKVSLHVIYKHSVLKSCNKVSLSLLFLKLGSTDLALLAFPEQLFHATEPFCGPPLDQF